MVDKITKEVEQNSKATATIKKTQVNVSRDRGCGNVFYTKNSVVRTNDPFSHGGFNHREYSNNGGNFHNNSHRGSYGGYHGGGDGYYSGGFNGNSQNNPASCGNFGQGHQNDPNNFQSKMLPWIPQG